MFRTRWALATLLAGCLLAGCSGDDPEPKIDTEPTPSEISTSASVSVSPTLTPTAVVGPEETVRAWVQARNGALQDGDTAAVRALSAADCQTCDQHIEPIETVYAAGGQFVTPGWTVDRLKLVKAGDNEAKVDVAMTMAAGQTMQEAGGEPTPYPEDHRLMFFRLGEEAGDWRITLIGYYS